MGQCKERSRGEEKGRGKERRKQSKSVDQGGRGPGRHDEWGQTDSLFFPLSLGMVKEGKEGRGAGVGFEVVVIGWLNTYTHLRFAFV